MSNIILILGGGPNVGLSVARVFSTKGSYKTVSVSRTPKEELIKATDLSLILLIPTTSKRSLMK